MALFGLRKPQPFFCKRFWISMAAHSGLWCYVMSVHELILRWSRSVIILSASSFFFCTLSVMPSGSDLGHNWKPGTGEIPLLTAIGGHWGPVIPTSATIGRDSFTLTAVGRHWGPVIWIPTLARIGKYSFTLTAVGRHWGPVIPTSARIGRDPSTLTAVGRHWIQTLSRIGSPGPGWFPYSFRMGYFRCMNHRQSTHHSACRAALVNMRR
jgi:hypothetical protein